MGFPPRLGPPWRAAVIGKLCGALVTDANSIHKGSLWPQQPPSDDGAELFDEGAEALRF